jgi:hypothetical protein
MREELRVGRKGTHGNAAEHEECCATSKGLAPVLVGLGIGTVLANGVTRWAKALGALAESAASSAGAGDEHSSEVVTNEANARLERRDERKEGPHNCENGNDNTKLRTLAKKGKKAK